MATTATFCNVMGAGGALAPRARCKHEFDQTPSTFKWQLCRSGRGGMGQAPSLRVRAEERSESSPRSRPEPGKELPDRRLQHLRKIDQPVKSFSPAPTEPMKENSDGNFGTTFKTALRCYFNEVTTGWARILNDRNPALALGNVLRKEGHLIYMTMCNDFSSAVLTYWCIGANLLTVSPFLQTGDYQHFLLQVATTMSKEVAYSFLFLYSFNFANQYIGADGDEMDKPWRPIPSGLLSKEGALARCFLVNSLYTFVSYHLGVLHWTLIWQAIIASQFFGYEKDDASRGLGRGLAMFAGTFVQCAAGVALSTTMTSTLLLWSVTRSAATGNHHWMQDFRDIEGDRRIGRTTFPLMFGVETARKLMAFIFLMDPIYMHNIVMKDSGYSKPQLFLEGLGAVLSAIVAFRVLYLKTPEEDHETYTLWHTTFWHNWTFLVVGPAFLVGLNSQMSPQINFWAVHIW